MRVKPSDGALDDVVLVRWIDERVPLVGIDNHLRLDAEVLQRVPELEGLRWRALSVAFTDEDERAWTFLPA